MADAANDIEEHGGLARTMKDLFAGAAGGVAQVLLGMSKVFASFLSFKIHVFPHLWAFGMSHV